MRTRQPTLLAAVAGAALLIAVAGCGGGSSSSASNASAKTTKTTSGTAARRGAFSNPKLTACLKKQGVTLPSFQGRGAGGFRGRTTPNGGPPTGTNRQGPPNGGGFRGGGQFAQRFQKLREALQKCGASFPQRGGAGRPGGYGGGGYGGPPPGAAPGNGTGSNS